jgi:molybdopterin-guanine dinucleotide biosynthesis protein A
MGRDKALVMLGGMTLLERAYHTLSQVTPRTVVCGPSAYGRLLPDFETIDDAIAGAGPLGGIVAALRHAGGHCLVVACDMPFLSVPLLRHLAELAPTADAVVPDVDGMLHPAHAVYSAACLPHFERQLAAGDYRVHTVFQSVVTRYVERDEIERFDPSLRSLMNVNTPDDLATAERMLAGD